MNDASKDLVLSFFFIIYMSILSQSLSLQYPKKENKNIGPLSHWRVKKAALLQWSSKISWSTIWLDNLISHAQS